MNRSIHNLKASSKRHSLDSTPSSWQLTSPDSSNQARTNIRPSTMQRLSRRSLRIQTLTTSAPLSARSFHPAAARSAYKDDQDRSTLKPRSSEYTQSGTDHEAAHTDSAFDPSDTSPESSIKRRNGSGKNQDVLDATGGNDELNRDQKNASQYEDTAVASNREKTGRSKSRDAPKLGGGQYGG